MYKTIEEIKEANKAIGHYFFNPNTMKAWASRVLSTVYGGRYFVTSELNYDKTKRVYTVRECIDGDCHTVEFNSEKYGNLTKAKAIKLAKKLAAQGE